MKKLPYNLVLIGFMGTGKTTVSRTLAKRLSMKEVDIDQCIVQRTGKSISAIFEEDGESVFRQMETAMLAELQQQTGLIISCGGGLAMQDHNVPIMKQGGLVLLLTATPQTVLRRVRHSTHRPLLNGKMNVKAIADLMSQRSQKYKAAADLTVSTDFKSISKICEEILSLLPHTPLRRI